MPPANLRNLCRIITAVVMMAAGCAAHAADAAAGVPLDKVTLQLKWRHQFQFAGYYAAIAQGYYREAGLEVVLREAEPGKNPVEEVFAGRAEFGVGNSDLLLSRAEGKPAVVLAAIFQHSPLALVARAVDGITSMPDLHNRPMMMVESEKAEILAYFKHEGVGLAGLKIRPHTQRIEDFIEGKVDAMSAYVTDQPFNLREAGVKYLIFVARSGGIDFYGDNLFTTEEQIRRHPERVRAFRAASLKGWDYALAHSEEIVDLILREYTTRHSREHLLFEAAKTAELMHPGVIESGHNNPGRWRHIADTYAEFGMLPRDFPLDGFIYDPNPKPDIRWVYWSLGGLGAVAVCALGWLLPLVRLNRRLRKEVEAHRKTAEELRRAKEAAEASDRMKGRYLAVMSHEVRTPIGGIIGLVNLLQMEPLAREQRETVDLVERSANSLLKLIDGLLDQARLGEGRMELEVTPVPVGAFTAEICELFRGSAQAKGLTLVCNVDAAVPDVVHTDGQRLRQILSNLLSNAVKFTETGGVRVDVALAGERVRFRVSDTGMGIPAEKLGRLFDPYMQADASITRRFGGTGLGLAISRDLARLLGGDVTVESIPGRGSTFTVEITPGVALSKKEGASVI